MIQSIPKFEKTINKTRMQNALLSNRLDEYVEFKWSETIVNIKTVFILCEEAHSAIAHLFYKGRGMHLMFMESEICSRVIQRALNDNIVMRPIQDSFIVELQYEDWLERVMLEEYEYVTGRMTIVK